MCLLGETNMKKLQWIVLLGIIAYQPVHTSLNEMVARFAATPSFGFSGDDGSCDPNVGNC